MKLIRTSYYAVHTRGGGLYRDEIPPDMLRYDLAFASDRHPGVVMFPVFSTSYGVNKSTPTVARWRSFGVKITRIDEVSIELKLGLDSMDRWHTYRHPVSVDGQMDYSKLEAVEFDRFLRAKTLMDIE